VGGLLRPDPGSISVNGIDARRFSDTQADDRLDSRQTDGFVVILDEPFTGLDAASARQIKTVPRERLRDRDTVIMITHVLEVAERLADLIGNLADLIGNLADLIGNMD
jgi:excinuclease UvrABC ATPase subunit